MSEPLLGYTVVFDSAERASYCAVHEALEIFALDDKDAAQVMVGTVPAREAGGVSGRAVWWTRRESGAVNFYWQSCQ